MDFGLVFLVTEYIEQDLDSVVSNDQPWQNANASEMLRPVHCNF
jgi:hypothetical protein